MSFIVFLLNWVNSQARRKDFNDKPHVRINLCIDVHILIEFDHKIIRYTEKERKKMGYKRDEG